MGVPSIDAGELKALIALSKRRALNFGLCLGSKPEETVFVIDRRLAPEKLGREAKKIAKMPKPFFGTLQTEQKTLMLTCLSDPPSGAARRTRAYLATVGLKMKVVLLDTSGGMLEATEDDEDDSPAQGEAPAAETGGDFVLADLKANSDALAQMIKAHPEKKEGFVKLIAQIRAKATSGDPRLVAEAEALLARLKGALTAGAAPKARPVWQVFVTGLTPATVTLDVGPDTLLRDVFEAYCGRLGVPSDVDARMVYAGRTLDLAQTLAAAGIDNNTTLQVLLRLRGGVLTPEMKRRKTGPAGSDDEDEDEGSDEEDAALFEVDEEEAPVVAAAPKSKKRSLDTLSDEAKRAREEADDAFEDALSEEDDAEAEDDIEPSKSRIKPAPALALTGIEQLDREIGVLNKLSGRTDRTGTLCMNLVERIQKIAPDKCRELKLDVVIRALVKGLECGWHDELVEGSPALLAASLVNVRTDRRKFTTPEGTQDEVIDRILIGGRPRGKHASGKQGQHVTSFATAREILVGSCCGLTPTEASENLSCLFANLLKYPAFSEDPFSRLADPSLVETIKSCADFATGPIGTAALSGLSVSEAMVFYLEVREAMPGASLAATSVLDTQGHGEPKALALIRDTEKVLAGLGPEADLTAKQLFMTVPRRADAPNKPGVLDALLMLVDGPAPPHDPDSARDTNALARLKAEDESLLKMQIKTFVMSLSEAFTDTLWQSIPKAVVEEGLAKKYKIDASYADKSIIEWLIRYLCDAYDISDESFVTDTLKTAEGMTSLEVPTDATNRAVSGGFCGGLIAPRAGELEIDFNGRPAAYKPGGQEGDHTVAMTLLNKSMTRLLIAKGTPPQGDQIPTAQQLCSQAEKILNAFAPEKYIAIFYPELKEKPEEAKDKIIALRDGFDTAAATKDHEDPAFSGILKRFIGPKASAGDPLNVGMLYYADEVRKLVERLRPNEGVKWGLGEEVTAKPVATSDFLSMAENLLGLINTRPTAVVPSGAAGSTGHGEPYYNAALSGLQDNCFVLKGIHVDRMKLPDSVPSAMREALLLQNETLSESDARDIFGEHFETFRKSYVQHALVGLLDLDAVCTALRMKPTTPKEEEEGAGALIPDPKAYLSKVIWECSTFAQLAYPESFALIGREAFQAHLVELLPNPEDL